MSEIRHAGGCLCGEVRYSVGPATYQLMCLCDQCQKIGGGFGMEVFVVPMESVTVEKGEGFIQDFVIKGSDKGVVRRFCKNCGTHIMASNSALPVMGVCAGTLDDHTLIKPDVAIWCQSKRSYHRVPEGVPEFDQYPPRPE